MARIMVVEDDEWYRALLVEMLGQDGHEVIEAGDGVQALAYLKDSTADLMIIDMLMPNKDGVDTIMELQQLGMTMLMVTHDEQMAMIASRRLRLDNGRVLDGLSSHNGHPTGVADHV